MRYFLSCFIVLFVQNISFAQIAVPNEFVGINAWMPDSTGTHKYYGKLHDKWDEIGEANPSIIRIGGIGADKRVFTNHQLLELIDSIRMIGAEPLIQVSLWGGTFTDTAAADLVEYINITKSKDVKYWAIGNEPNLVYDDTNYDSNFSDYYVIDYANHVKSFSLAMKAKDADIKIVAGELAGYVSSWVDSLLTPGGPADITGNNGTYDYVDIFSYHTYPFSGSQTKEQVFGSLATYEGRLSTLQTKTTAANAFHSRNNDLGFAITELNVNYLNPSSNAANGVGTNSFLAGQWWSDMIHTSLAYGTEFLCFWSVIEGSDGSATDHGFISHTTGKLKPTYYHFQNTAQYLVGNQYTCTDNQDSVKVYAAGNDDGYTVTVLNYQDSEFPLHIQLNTASISGSSALEVNVDLNLSESYLDTLEATSTHWLFFTKNGHYVGRLSYTEEDAVVNDTPEFESYNPNRSPKVFAHYLPWFDDNTGGYGRSGWCHEGDCTDLTNKSSIYTPLIGEYSQFDQEVLKYHIRTAIAARIDGFLVNVNPIGDFQTQVLSNLCSAVQTVNAECGSNNFKVAISLDNSSLTAYSDIHDLFQEVEDSLYTHAEYQNLSWTDDVTEKPVLMVWSEVDWDLYRQAIDSVFGKDEIIAIGINSLRQNNYDAHFEWVNNLWTSGSAYDTTTNWGEQYFNDFDWGMGRQVEYGRTTDYRFTSTLKMGGVYPGFTDENVPSFWNGGNWRYIKREVTDGSTMDLTWNKQFAYTSDRYGGGIDVFNPWIQIITWNDFPEGTAIEPSLISQYGFAPMEQNREHIATFKSVSTTDEDTLGIYVPYEIYKAIDEGRSTAAADALGFLCSKDYNSAYSAAKGTLPVEWLAFWGKERDQSIELQWTIASFDNHSHFEIQRSEDGLHFKTIGTDTKEQYHYTFEDKNLQANPLYYYRIRQIDKDGTEDFTSIISFRLGENNFSFQHTNGWLSFNQSYKSIKIYNSLGQLLIDESNSQNIDLNPFPKGVYQIVVFDGLKWQKQSFYFQ